MSSETVISVQNVSKAYRIWESPASRFTSPLQTALASLFPPSSSVAKWFQKKAARGYRDFWALRNISLDIRKGECVGIIGRNGSGKSTLLQIIAGTLRPTDGSAKVTGRVAALLELGSGFNPEFTGRENVFLNGTVMGMSRAEMEARYGEIAEFADIGEFLDQPVKTYSSGMMVRLAFAVSIAIRPDILIVDEALSVGDAAFQRKCYRRIEELRERGCTLLFVSHDLNAVINLCSYALLLEKGETLLAGLPQDCGNRYQQLIFGETTVAQLTEYGDSTAHFEDIWVENMEGERVPSVPSGAAFQFCYRINFEQDVANPVFGLRATNVHGVLLVSTNTHMLHRPTGPFRTGSTATVKWRLTLPVVPGYIFFSAGCSYSDRDAFLCRKLDVLKIPIMGTFTNAGLLQLVGANEVAWRIHD